MNLKDKLGLLTLFHYILGGLTAFFALIALIYIFMGVLMLTGIIKADDGQIVPVFFAWGCIILSSLLFVVCSILSFCTVLAGLSIRNKKNYNFCLIVAAVNSIFFPLGTILGGATLWTLLNDNIKKGFKKRTFRKIVSL